mmetsp:Transcript_3261/g.8316  ORF Transcript_3261/g.8316 Transcript_3261/m.8316 type:complete len:125 (+) Transcript_3261:112-486(+)
MSYLVQSSHEVRAESNSIQAIQQNKKSSRPFSSRNTTDDDREQINNSRFNKENYSQKSQANKIEVGGLGTELIKLMKKASQEKKASSGKRKPLGNVSNGRRLLESKAASKRELERIQGSLNEIC